jgi:lactose/L-arabinose transport system permease protein
MKIRKSELTPYLFISPFYILFGIFWMFPFLYSLILSFSKSTGIEFGALKFVGLHNYLSLLQEEVFWITLLNTAMYWLLQVPILTLGGLIAAVVLNSKLVKFGSTFQLIYLLPYVTSGVVIAIVFSILFDESFGLINTALMASGIPKIRWFSRDLSKVTVSLLINWKWVGYNMLLMLGGLQNVPRELYDAAKVDGASSVQRFFKITIPLMMPVIVFCTIMSTMGAFRLFTEVFIMTVGGPSYSSYTFGFFLYNQAFEYFKFEYAAAIGFIMFIFILTVSLLQFKYLRVER